MASSRSEYGEKPTNPKDAIGTGKVSLSLFPSTAIALGALAMTDGALKYGRDNFRAIGVRSSIYVDAALRHLHYWNEGEEFDPDSGVHHLGHVLACIAILVDSMALDNMNDDRKITGGFRPLMDELTPEVRRLQELHKDKAPKHYSIQDNYAEG